MLKKYFFPSFLLLSFCMLQQRSLGQSASSKPNIIFILADDLGWGELGCYGNTFNETPNLDNLAAGGIRFTQAYAAAPLCSPTRASIMTGEYPVRTEITDFLAPKSPEYLDPGKFTTINEMLSRAGYHSGIIGKWHLDTHFGNIKGGPKDFHFDEVIASETKYIAGGDYFYPYDKIATIKKGAKGEYLTDRQSQEAVKFIKRNQDQPFFLYLTYYAVHTKLAAPKNLVKKYKKKYDAKYGDGMAEKIYGPKNKRHEADHVDNPYLAAMLERIDAGVGSIMKALRKAGIAENTLVVFFSDNGGAHGVANNGGLRKGKTWLYEGGIREPLIMRWPEKIDAGRVSAVPVCSIDFYPTFLAMAGLAPPKDQTLDGISLLPLLSKEKKPDTRPLYWFYPANTMHWKNRMAAAIRKGDYKLIHFFKDGRTALYNLKNDPEEKNNLAKKQPEKTAELKKLLEYWRKETGAKNPLAPSYQNNLTNK